MLKQGCKSAPLSLAARCDLCRCRGVQVWRIKELEDLRVPRLTRFPVVLPEPVQRFDSHFSASHALCSSKATMTFILSIRIAAISGIPPLVPFLGRTAQAHTLFILSHLDPEQSIVGSRIRSTEQCDGSHPRLVCPFIHILADRKSVV